MATSGTKWVVPSLVPNWAEKEVPFSLELLAENLEKFVLVPATFNGVLTSCVMLLGREDKIFPLFVALTPEMMQKLEPVDGDQRARPQLVRENEEE